MVAVPADAAADVQQDLRHERQDRADLVGDGLGRMVVAGVEREEHSARQRVAEVELVRADGVALDADAEQLAFDRVEVEGLGSIGSSKIASSASVSRSRGACRSAGVSFMPSGIQSWSRRACRAPCPMASPIFAAGDAVADPELADGLVGVRERGVVGGLRVREIRRVEVQADAERLGPVDPAREVLGPDLVAIDLRAAELAVEGVEVEAVAARDERERLVGVGAQFVRRAGGSRVVAGGREAAAEFAAELLEAAHVVALPAVQRNRDRREPGERRLGVHAEFLVALLLRAGRPGRHSCSWDESFRELRLDGRVAVCWASRGCGGPRREGGGPHVPCDVCAGLGQRREAARGDGLHHRVPDRGRLDRAGQYRLACRGRGRLVQVPVLAAAADDLHAFDGRARQLFDRAEDGRVALRQRVEDHLGDRVLPSNAADAKGLLKTACREEDPVLFLEHKGLYRQNFAATPEPDSSYLLPFGLAKVVRKGTDITIITYGMMVQRSLEAARRMEAEGVSVEIIDLRTLNPLDRETMLASVKKNGKVLIVHEDTLTGGFGAELAAIIAGDAFQYLDAPVRRVAAKDSPVPYSPPLEYAMLPQEADISQALQDLAQF